MTWHSISLDLMEFSMYDTPLSENVQSRPASFANTFMEIICDATVLGGFLHPPVQSQTSESAFR